MGWYFKLCLIELSLLLLWNKSSNWRKFSSNLIKYFDGNSNENENIDLKFVIQEMKNQFNITKALKNHEQFIGI